MSKQAKKLTPWFSGDVKPVHVGVYEREAFKGSCGKYSYWNGRRFFIGDTSPLHAVKWRSASFNQSARWRGLARRPSK